MVKFRQVGAEMFDDNGRMDVQSLQNFQSLLEICELANIDHFVTRFKHSQNTYLRSFFPRRQCETMA
jgi:hypothetical protein